ncbi:MAG: hypothetical protein HPY53_08375 [Brevinematales bacterium]|nr:hypothetical protein [Brevinematales bacterium]
MFRHLFPILSFLLFFGRVFGIQFIKPYIQGDKVVFSFIGGGSFSEDCFLIGTFNGWESGKHQFKKKGSNLFIVAVTLAPGKYEYQYSIEGRWVPDESNPLTEGDGFGGVNSVLYVKDDGSIDWAHADRYDPDQEFEKMMHQTMPTLYSVQLKGNYHIDLMTLIFTNLEIVFSNGIARILETKSGVTGLHTGGIRRLYRSRTTRYAPIMGRAYSCGSTGTVCDAEARYGRGLYQSELSRRSGVHQL